VNDCRSSARARLEIALKAFFNLVKPRVGVRAAGC